MSIDFVKNKTVSKLAFGSCHNNKFADPTIWKTIGEEKADVFLWTGDAVYVKGRTVASLEQLAIQYNATKHNAGYAEFRSSRDVFGTWDDHDAGLNDGGRELIQKAERRDLYWDFLELAPIQRDGLYYSVSYNRLQILFLDTRWFRDRHCIPSVAGKLPLGTGIACLTRWLTIGLDLKRYHICDDSRRELLGAQQWQWLQRQLQLDFDLRIVVSSIQVLTSNPAMESWMHFREEQRKLVDLLAKSGVDLILSGDVHHGELLDPNLLEVTSSGLTHDCSRGIYGVVCRPLLEIFHGHRQNKSNYYIGRNYGTLNIDWEQRVFQVNVHDVEHGQIRLTTGPRPFRIPSTEQVVIPTVEGHLIPVFVAVVVLLGTIVGVRLRMWSTLK